MKLFKKAEEWLLAKMEDINPNINEETRYDVYVSDSKEKPAICIARTYHKTIHHAKLEVKKWEIIKQWNKCWLATNTWYTVEGHEYEEIEVK